MNDSALVNKTIKKITAVLLEKNPSSTAEVTELIHKIITKAYHSDEMVDAKSFYKELNINLHPDKIKQHKELFQFLEQFDRAHHGDASIVSLPHTTFQVVHEECKNDNTFWKDAFRERSKTLEFLLTHLFDNPMLKGLKRYVFPFNLIFWGMYLGVVIGVGGPAILGLITLGLTTSGVEKINLIVDTLLNFVTANRYAGLVENFRKPQFEESKQLYIQKLRVELIEKYKDKYQAEEIEKMDDNAILDLDVDFRLKEERDLYEGLKIMSRNKHYKASTELKKLYTSQLRLALVNKCTEDNEFEKAYDIEVMDDDAVWAEVENTEFETNTHIVQQLQLKGLKTNKQEIIEDINQQKELYIKKIKSALIECYTNQPSKISDLDNMDDTTLLDLFVDLELEKEPKAYKRLQRQEYQNHNQAIMDMININSLNRVRFSLIALYHAIVQPLNGYEGNKFVSVAIIRPLQALVFPIIFAAEIIGEAGRFLLQGVANLDLILALGLYYSSLYALNIPLNLYEAAERFFYKEAQSTQPLLMIEYVKSTEPRNDLSIQPQDNLDLPPPGHFSSPIASPKVVVTTARNPDPEEINYLSC